MNFKRIMGYSIGTSDSYYKITEEELLYEYLKAVEDLTLSSENQLQNEVSKIILKSK